MKERIVISRNTETSEYYKKFTDRSGKQIEHIEVLAPIEQNVRFDKVPETFEELKELCRELKNKDIIIYDDAITIDFPSINGGFNFHIYITKNEIDINISIFAQNRTIPQIWAFIKSLIGEE